MDARSGGKPITIAVTGATGNVGSSLVAALSSDARVDRVVGIARRSPSFSLPKVEWRAADVETDDLAPLFAGMDAVVHLAWRIQPSRDLKALWRTNVLGSERVFAAAVDAGVRSLVVASSVGVYSPGPKDRRVDESWPRDGVRSSLYSRHKAAMEQRLDLAEASAPELRVVRMRPALTFKRGAASGIRRLFLGPFFPGWLASSRMILLVPATPRLAFQAVHTDDVAKAYCLAIHSSASGSFNIGAEPVLDVAVLSRLAQAHPVRVRPGLLRRITAATWALRLQPTPPGWVDLGLGVPLMDCSRAREHLGWAPTIGADQALVELGEGLREDAGSPTPPLQPPSGKQGRVHELATGVGAKDEA